MHTLQKLLITRLLKDNGLNFANLTRGYDAEDNIVFHLKQLVTKGYVEKKKERYYLTAEGVSTVNTFQKTDLQDNHFKMAFVGFICESNGKYLIKPHSNAVETFYNLPSGSPLFGEDLVESLQRTFYQETDLHLSGELFTFDSLHMKTLKTTDGSILFDDAFIAYNVDLTNVPLDKMMLKKGCVWLSVDEIKNLANKWPEIDLCILRQNWEVYKKYTIISDYILK